jgi:hypothetical protein
VLTAQAGVVTTSQPFFTLNALDQVASFQALFNEWRIDALRVKIVPQNNAIGLVTNTTTSLVELYNVIDYNDSTALASVAAAREYENCMVLAPGESGERVFQPRAATAMYQGAFTAYGNVGGAWVDIAYPGTIHYGMKIIIPAATVGQTLLQSWDVFFEAFVSFRNVH